MKKLILTLILALALVNINAQTVIDSLWNVQKEMENADVFDAEKYSENANSLLFCLMSISDYYNAEIVCNAAYDFLSTHVNGDNSKYLMTLSLYLSKIQIMLMNYEYAKETLNRVIAECEKRNEYGDIFMLAYLNLSQVYFNLQDYKAMKKYMDISISKYEELYGDIFETKDELYFLIINNYGISNYYNGQKDLAEKCFKYVIDNSTGAFESNDAYPLALANYSHLLIEQHKYKQAEQLLTQANTNNWDYNLKIVEKMVLTNFAQNKFSQMIKNLVLYNSIASRNAATIFSNFSKDERENYWSKLSFDMMLLNNFVAWYRDKTNAPEIAYNASLFCRNLLSNSEKILETEIEKSSDNQLKIKYDKLKLMQNDYTFRNGDSLFKDSLKNEIVFLEDDIMRSIPNLDSLLVNSSKTWSDVKNSLDDDEYALEFVFSLIRKWEGKKVVGVDTIYTVLLTGNKFKRPIVDICTKVKRFDSTYIISAVDALNYNLIYTNETNKLYNTFFKYLMKYLKNAHTIYYSPCGNLSLLNFDLFTDDTGTPLNQKYKMVRVSSTAEIPQVKARDLQNLSSAALYGNINYDTSFYDSSRGSKFGRLKNAGKEINSISNILKGQNITSTIFDRTSATEESFKNLSGKSPEILHLATHGFCFETDEKAADKPFAQNINSYSQKESAMVLSGLALSGANNIWKGKNALPNNVEDGILTAYEISQLDLSNTKLVVLSACETARGKIFPVDGVFGLQRAFKQAGAGAILMSLWKVDDGVTAIFMEHFYKFLFQSNGRHKALKLAQDEVKKQFPDPYYWAAWVMLD